MKQPQVLIVEDETLLRTAVVRLVRSLGYEAHDACDGEQACRKMAEHDYAVVISDINMPHMDGMELLRRVRIDHPEVPVILLTGMPALETAIRAVDFGAFQYIVKPFAPQDMQQLLQRAVGVRQMARLQREALMLASAGNRESEETASIRAAWERVLGTMRVALQPIFDVKTGLVYGREALMRPVAGNGLDDPEAVLAAGEKLNRLYELRRKIENLASGAMRAKTDQSLLFMNLHPLDLMDDALYAADSPLAATAGRVVLEVTERASLDRVHSVQERLKRLRWMGFRIAVDDLGAGYAGLTSFALLHPEFVKIDMCLVRDVDTDPLKQRLIRSMTEVSRDMGIQVIAEGIETETERATVAELGCDLLQGFLLGQPVITEDTGAPERVDRETPSTAHPCAAPPLRAQ